MWRILVTVVMLVLVAACASDPGGITLRPQPADSARSGLAEAIATAPPPSGTLSATLRRPAGDGDDARFYARRSGGGRPRRSGPG